MNKSQELLIYSAIAILMAAVNVNAQSSTQVVSDPPNSFGSYNLFGWGENFQSPVYLRSWGGNESQNQLDYYGVFFEQPDGSQYVGLDVGVQHSIIDGTRVSTLSNSNSAHVGDLMKFRFDGSLNPLDGGSVPKGFWYMGPKTLILSTSNWQGGLGGDNFECYIIEQSNLTQAEFFTAIYNAGGAINYRGQSVHWDGQRNVTYKHFTRTFDDGSGSFTQVFALKDSWNTQLTETQVNTQVNWIQHMWLALGIIPNDPANGKHYYNLGWKANIEFAGKFAPSYCNFSFLDLAQNP